MTKLTWLDDESANALEAELASLEEDEGFLQRFYGFSMLLEAIQTAEADDAIAS